MARNAYWEAQTMFSRASLMNCAIWPNAWIVSDQAKMLQTKISFPLALAWVKVIPNGQITGLTLFPFQWISISKMLFSFCFLFWFCSSISRSLVLIWKWLGTMCFWFWFIYSNRKLVGIQQPHINIMTWLIIQKALTALVGLFSSKQH